MKSIYFRLVNEANVIIVYINVFVRNSWYAILSG